MQQNSPPPLKPEPARHKPESDTAVDAIRALTGALAGLKADGGRPSGGRNKISVPTLRQNFDKRSYADFIIDVKQYAQIADLPPQLMCYTLRHDCNLPKRISTAMTNATTPAECISILEKLGPDQETLAIEDKRALLHAPPCQSEESADILRYAENLTHRLRSYALRHPDFDFSQQESRVILTKLSGTSVKHTYLQAMLRVQSCNGSQSSFLAEHFENMSQVFRQEIQLKTLYATETQKQAFHTENNLFQSSGQQGEGGDSRPAGRQRQRPRSKPRPSSESRHPSGTEPVPAARPRSLSTSRRGLCSVCSFLGEADQHHPRVSCAILHSIRLKKRRLPHQLCGRCLNTKTDSCRRSECVVPRQFLCVPHQTNSLACPQCPPALQDNRASGSLPHARGNNFRVQRNDTLHHSQLPLIVREAPAGKSTLPPLNPSSSSSSHSTTPAPLMSLNVTHSTATYVPPDQIFHSIALRSETISVQISGVVTDCLVLYDSCSDTSILAMGEETKRKVESVGGPTEYTNIGLTTANAISQAKPTPLHSVRIQGRGKDYTVNNVIASTLPDGNYPLELINIRRGAQLVANARLPASKCKLLLSEEHADVFPVKMQFSEVPTCLKEDFPLATFSLSQFSGRIIVSGRVSRPAAAGGQAHGPHRPRPDRDDHGKPDTRRDRSRRVHFSNDAGRQPPADAATSDRGSQGQGQSRAPLLGNACVASEQQTADAAILPPTGTVKITKPRKPTEINHSPEGLTPAACCRDCAQPVGWERDVRRCELPQGPTSELLCGPHPTQYTLRMHSFNRLQADMRKAACVQSPATLSRAGCGNCDESLLQYYTTAASYAQVEFEKQLKFKRTKGGGLWTIDVRLPHMLTHVVRNPAQIFQREMATLRKLATRPASIRELDYLTKLRFNQGKIFWLHDLRHVEALQPRLLVLPRHTVATLSKSTPLRQTLCGNYSLRTQSTATCGSPLSEDNLSQLPAASTMENNVHKSGLFVCDQQQKVIPEMMSYNDMFLACTTSLQSIHKIWLAQQLAVSLAFCDIKSFFDSLALSLSTGLIQAEVFLQNRKGRTNVQPPGR